MWFATTDEEANFIFDLLADPNASEPVLDYARWLEDHGQRRAADFLRMELSPAGNEDRLKILRDELDKRWLDTLTSRHFRRGDVVHILGGEFQGMDGTVMEVDSRGARAGLFLHLFYRPTEWTWVNFRDLQLLKRAPEEQCQE